MDRGPPPPPATPTAPAHNDSPQPAPQPPQPAAAGGVSKRYRSAPAKTFQCRGYGECRMVFSRSEHLARHVRKHTGERPFACHCGKQFSRLDNLRQHAQTVHSDKHAENDAMMRELTSLHTQLAASSSKANRDTAVPSGAPSNAQGTEDRDDRAPGGSAQRPPGPPYDPQAPYPPPGMPPGAIAVPMPYPHHIPGYPPPQGHYPPAGAPPHIAYPPHHPDAYGHPAYYPGSQHPFPPAGYGFPPPPSPYSHSPPGSAVRYAPYPPPGYNPSQPGSAPGHYPSGASYPASSSTSSPTPHTPNTPNTGLTQLNTALNAGSGNSFLGPGSAASGPQSANSGGQGSFLAPGSAAGGPTSPSGAPSTGSNSAHSSPHPSSTSSRHALEPEQSTLQRQGSFRAHDQQEQSHRSNGDPVTNGNGLVHRPTNGTTNEAGFGADIKPKRGFDDDGEDDGGGGDRDRTGNLPSGFDQQPGQGFDERGAGFGHSTVYRARRRSDEHDDTRQYANATSRKTDTTNFVNGTAHQQLEYGQPGAMGFPGAAGRGEYEQSHHSRQAGPPESTGRSHSDGRTMGHSYREADDANGYKKTHSPERPRSPTFPLSHPRSPPQTLKLGGLGMGMPPSAHRAAAGMRSGSAYTPRVASPLSTTFPSSFSNMHQGLPHPPGPLTATAPSNNSFRPNRSTTMGRRVPSAGDLPSLPPSPVAQRTSHSPQAASTFLHTSSSFSGTLPQSIQEGQYLQGMDGTPMSPGHGSHRLPQTMVDQGQHQQHTQPLAPYSQDQQESDQPVWEFLLNVGNARSPPESVSPTSAMVVQSPASATTQQSPANSVNTTPSTVPALRLPQVPATTTPHSHSTHLISPHNTTSLLSHHDQAQDDLHLGASQGDHSLLGNSLLPDGPSHHLPPPLPPADLSQLEDLLADSTLYTGHDRQLGYPPPIQRPMFSREAPNAPIRPTPAMEAAPLMEDVRMDSDSNSLSRELQERQEQQMKRTWMNMDGHQAGGFPSWNSAPPQRPPLAGHGQQAPSGLLARRLAAAGTKSQSNQMELDGPEMSRTMMNLPNLPKPSLNGMSQLGPATAPIMGGYHDYRLQMMPEGNPAPMRTAMPLLATENPFMHLTLPPAPVTSPGVALNGVYPHHSSQTAAALISPLHLLPPHPNRTTAGNNVQQERRRQPQPPPQQRPSLPELSQPLHLMTDSSFSRRAPTNRAMWTLGINTHQQGGNSSHLRHYPLSASASLPPSMSMIGVPDGHNPYFPV